MKPTNSEGMTCEEWCCAAGEAREYYTQQPGQPLTARMLELRAAWSRGEDPTEHRAEPKTEVTK